MESMEHIELSYTESSRLSTATTPAQEIKKYGRPTQWTDSRQRKLARLYLYTNLPPKDIRQALSDETANWVPEKETTTKTFNFLLDKDPRWLRPRTREEMDERILQLADCKAQRQLKREFRKDRATNDFDAIVEETTTNVELELDYEFVPVQDDFSNGAVHDVDPAVQEFSWAEFTRTPVQDLQALDLPSSSISILTHSVNLADDAISPHHAFQDSTFAEFNRSQNAHEQTLHSPRKSFDSISISSLKSRLSGYSSLYLDGITKLLKTYSISGSSSASSTDPSWRFSINTAFTNLPPSENKDYHPFLVQVALPRAFLVVNRHRKAQGFCFPGTKNHDSGMCWCMEDLEKLPKSKRWCIDEALRLRLVFDPPRSLRNLTLNFVDAFGNTILHFLAARGAGKSVIVDALEKGADGTAKNAAGQTFIHCFCPQFLVSLADDGQPALMAFLQKLMYFNVNFREYDPFGRRFAHLIAQEAKDVFPHSLSVLDFLNIRLPLTRDAFGWMPVLDSITQVRPRRNSGRSYKTWVDDHWVDLGGIEDLTGVVLDIPSLPAQRSIIDPHNKNAHSGPVIDDCLIARHTGLLHTANIALDNPVTQDAQGRNGLQCLAEVSLALHVSTKKLDSKKRKRLSDSTDTHILGLQFRFELVRNMIAQNVDVNNYDERGNTVLMAFVAHAHDSEDDNTLSAMLRYLIKNGADVHRRNRQGETALHIAVKQGHKVATAVLLGEGANVHARTLEGKGVLAVGERHYFAARANSMLYASILACMALCMHHGAIASPTLVQEWSPSSNQKIHRILKI